MNPASSAKVLLLLTAPSQPVMDAAIQATLLRHAISTTWIKVTQPAAVLSFHVNHKDSFGNS